jgi:hypothetical protein
MNNTVDTKCLCQQKALHLSLLSKEVAVADLRRNRMKLFENRVLRRIFGPRRDK